jgi:hypothetical protein
VNGLIFDFDTLNYCKPSDEFFEDGNGIIDYPAKQIPDKYLGQYQKDAEAMSKPSCDIYGSNDTKEEVEASCAK